MFLVRRLPVLAVLCCAWFEVALAEKLEISGVNNALKKNVIAFVKLSQEPCDAKRWRIRRRFDAADEQVKKALQAFGYYSPNLKKELKWEKDCWQAKFDIDPGPPVVIRKLDFELEGSAKNDKDFKVAKTRLAPGLPLLHNDYRDLKEKLQLMAADRGYFDSRFTKASIEVWPEKKIADITVHFDSGDRYRFGEVTVEQDFLESKIVSRYINIKPGDPYLSDEIANLQQKMNSSGYFSVAQVRPNITAREDGRVPILIVLSPSRRIIATVGGGFSTDKGIRLRSGYENRRINARGDQWRGDLLLSEVTKQLSVDYRRPLGLYDTEWISFGGGIENENTDTSESDSFTLGVRHAKQLARDWIRTDGLRLTFDDFEVGGVTDNSRLLIPSVGFSRKRGDEVLNPDNGHRVNVELSGASESLGSSTSFLQLRSSFKWIHALGSKGRVLVRAEAGTTLESEFNELPPDVRFFAGGIETVRGYGFETLGPTDESGLVVGGSHLLAASIEYDRLFYRNFAYAFFLDAGNAFDGTNIEPRVGTGFGIKWRSPIGPFRVYLAHPVNFSDRRVRLHVSIGPDL